MDERPDPDLGWRPGRHNPRNLYFDGVHVGVMFDPVDGPAVAAVLDSRGLRPGTPVERARVPGELGPVMVERNPLQRREPGSSW